ncbi:hypothetical protein RCJ22_26825 [Vibrio sp. FNV 38]|nr:hypothetical protein [Vibrio sp. FNV 38]
MEFENEKLMGKIPMPSRTVIEKKYQQSNNYQRVEITYKGVSTAKLISSKG